MGRKTEGEGHRSGSFAGSTAAPGAVVLVIVLDSVQAMTA